MSFSSLSDLSRRHGLYISTIKSIIKDLKPVKAGNGKGKGQAIFYRTLDADTLIQAHLATPKKPPRDHYCKQSCYKHLKGMNQSTFYLLFKQLDAPQAKGEYWNGQKLISYYDFNEVSAYFERYRNRGVGRPQKQDIEVEDDAFLNEPLWPIPAAPVVPKLMQIMIRSRWINP